MRKGDSYSQVLCRFLAIVNLKQINKLQFRVRQSKSTENLTEQLELPILNVVCGRWWYFCFLGWTFVSRDFALNTTLCPGKCAAVYFQLLCSKRGGEYTCKQMSLCVEGNSIVQQSIPCQRLTSQTQMYGFSF